MDHVMSLSLDSATIKQLDDLRRACRGMGFQLASLAPRIRAVVVVDVAEEQTRVRAMNDEPDVGVHAHRPEPLVPGLVQLVKTEAGRCGIHL